MKRLLYSFLLLMALTPLHVALGAGQSGGELYMTPESILHAMAEPLEVVVYANTNGQTVNAIEGELAYNPSDLSVEKISTDGSILNTWSTTPSYDGASGVIKFSGWADHPFNGSGGKIITITFVPLRVGQGSIDFNSGAMLATDGMGSNIITTMRSTAYRIQPVQVQTLPPQAPPSLSTAASVTNSVPTPPVTSPSPSPSPAPSNAASAVLSGVELAPVIVPFLAILTLIAFCIAYVLHRFAR